MRSLGQLRRICGENTELLSMLVFIVLVYHGSSSSSSSQGSLYPVEARCGSLPCPPYTEYREIVCAQCTSAASICHGLQYNGLCFYECPLLTYAEDSHCYDCHQQCADGCHGPSSGECYQCVNVFVQSSGECAATCPSGTVKTKNYICVPNLGFDCFFVICYENNVRICLYYYYRFAGL